MSVENSQEYRRQYVMSHEAWYAAANGITQPEIYFGLYHPEGGTCGEMVFRWVQLGGKEFAPRLEVFNDAWGVLWELRDVIERLAALAESDPPPEGVAALLRECGFVDTTDRTMRDQKVQELPLANHVEEFLRTVRRDGKVQSNQITDLQRALARELSRAE